jgi:putative membrane protein
LPSADQRFREFPLRKLLKSPLTDPFRELAVVPSTLAALRSEISLRAVAPLVAHPSLRSSGRARRRLLKIYEENMHMKAFTPLLMIAMIAAGVGSTAASASAAPFAGNQSSSAASTTPSTADTIFVRKASQGNAKEIALGRIAITKGRSQAVKQYGQLIVHDHSAANRKLQGIASNAHLQWSPTGPDQRMAAQSLRAKQGASFDRAFAQRMVADHQKTIAMFQKEVRNGRDPAIKAYARETLPTLQEHLRKAKALTGNSTSIGRHGVGNDAQPGSAMDGRTRDGTMPTGGTPASAGSH